MNVKVPYLFWDERTRRVCGFGLIASEHWEIHQKHFLESRTDHTLRMVPIFDSKQLDALRAAGPQNFVVTADSTLELLPPANGSVTQ